MDWKNEAVDKLRKLELMRNSLDSIPQEIERLEYESRGLRSAGTEQVRVKGGGSREDALLGNMVRRQELENALFCARSWVCNVENALDTLGPEARIVLERMYVYPRRSGGMDSLCRDLDLVKSSVYRLRDEALREFTLAMYGCLES